MSSSSVSRRPKATHWFLRPVPQPDARLTLYCLPHAGGASSAYRHWPEFLPSWIELAAARLPGRESRFSEPAQIDPVAIANAIQADSDGLPYALFGHSMGGLLAFEVASLLVEGPGPDPLLLCVSGIPHPLVAEAPEPVSTLPTDELVVWISALGGSPETLLSDSRYQEMLLPPLRADCAWLESYVYRNRGRLPLPISAVAGQQDEHVDRDSLSAWSQETSRNFSMRQYPGGHFYPDEQFPLILSDLAADLDHSLASTCPPGEFGRSEAGLDPLGASGAGRGH